MYLQSIVKYQHLDKGSVWDNGRTEKNTCPLCQYRGEDRVKETSKQEAWGKHLSFQGHIFYCTRGPGSNLRTPFPQQLQENDRMHWEAKFCVSIAISSMTNLDSILKSRDITLPTKVRLVKTMVFPVVMYGCESQTVKKAECDLFGGKNELNFSHRKFQLWQKPFHVFL